MLEGAADRARCAIDQGRGELGAHAVDARLMEPGRRGDELGRLKFRVDVGAFLAAPVGLGFDQRGGVVRRAGVPVGFGLDGGEPLAGLGRLIAFVAQPGTLPLGVREPGRGGVNLGGQRRRADPGGPGGLVLVVRLPGHRPQRL